MNEKDYGGSAKFRNTGKSVKGNSEVAISDKSNKMKKEISLEDLEALDEDYEEFDEEKILEAGKIASQVMKYVREIVKPGVKLLDIAEKVEAKIEELGGKPAFPVNTSMNDVAAHYTPAPGDETVASGLLKVDFGAHVDGWISDTSISFDLDGTEENKTLIEAAEKALEAGLKKVKPCVKLSDIGKAVQETAESYKATPVINLTGHSISHYDVHSGLSVPNYDNGSDETFEGGLIAIEPFTTFGNGRVYDGKPSGIFQLISDRNVRSPIARKILDYVAEEYQTLPFCSRWIVKKFGNMGLLGLRQLEANGNLHQFEQLIETSHRNVAQAEHTVFVTDEGVQITTK